MTLANGDQDLCCHMASLGHNELRYTGGSKSVSIYQKKWLHNLYNSFNTWVINPVYLHEILCTIPQLAFVQRHLVLYKHVALAVTLMLVWQPVIFLDCSISPVTSSLWILRRYSPSELLLLLYVANSSIYTGWSNYLCMAPMLYQSIYQDFCT